MKLRPIIALSLTAAAGVVPGKPNPSSGEDSGQKPAEPVHRNAQQPVNVNAQHQQTHERLFGGAQGWVKQADGSQKWVGGTVRN
ncbi:hypothetical protein GLAREA_04864 [Glarea lozoyensis ATCC 20868]|uniref:Uncharacterized protein n=1 Tax=Glarea lozoyensis (strain ATCC 20868 / MF5171) TaxID=1116229 RepID=S3DNM1_GLAL2|nr:uncharacterized protein GLAREA_04864 [Glarea lozoyensis ATCC 20868]EPE28073.1 hypothetical protein GLAREA_04864 [Glarea lozoyensis ATCC 20868]